MSQQLQLFADPASLPSSSSLNPPLSDTTLTDITTNDTNYGPTGSDLLEQTRQLFQHSGSNAELMAQIMSAIRALNEICEAPKA